MQTGLIGRRVELTDDCGQDRGTIIGFVPTWYAEGSNPGDPDRPDCPDPAVIIEWDPESEACVNDLRPWPIPFPGLRLLPQD